MNTHPEIITEEMVREFTADIIADPTLDSTEKWVLVLAAEMAKIGFKLCSDGEDPSKMDGMFFAPSSWDGESATVVLRLDDWTPTNG
ncbi:hypothetical protein EDF68_104112 [Ochrobactrum sp. BH3]|nr:hypothetical protein EDF68_104112 [Ochrobactrum sp. BH3]